jgi:hypothetical protein
MSEVNKFIMNVNNQNLLIENSGPLPVTDSNEVKGGRFIVRTRTERNQIPLSKRKVGMSVYVLDDRKEYILSNQNNNPTTSDTDWTVQEIANAVTANKLAHPVTINGVSFDGSQSISIGSGEAYNNDEILALFNTTSVSISRVYDTIMPNYAMRFVNTINNEKSSIGETNITKDFTINNGDPIKIELYRVDKIISIPNYKISYELNKLDRNLDIDKLGLKIYKNKDTADLIPNGVFTSDKLDSIVDNVVGDTTYTLKDGFKKAIKLSAIFDNNLVSYYNIDKRLNMTEEIKSISLVENGQSFRVNVTFKTNSGNLGNNVSIIVEVPYKVPGKDNEVKFAYKYGTVTRNSAGSLVYSGNINDIGLHSSRYDFLNNNDGELDNFAVNIILAPSESVPDFFQI